MPARFVTLMNPRPRRRSRSRVSRGMGGRFVSRRRSSRVRTNPSARRIRRRRVSIHRNPPKMTPQMRRKISIAVKAANRRRAAGGGSRAVTSFRSGGSFRRRASGRNRLSSFTGSIKSALSKQLLMKAGGAVVASIGTGYIMNRFGASLPLANNKYGRMAYMFGIPVAAAYLIRNKNRDLAEGLVIGGLVMTINSLMQSFQVGAAVPAAALGSYGVAGELGRGAGFQAYPQNFTRTNRGMALGGSNVAFPSSAW